MRERRRILVQGIVQGVGFRPFVYGQALRHGLAGFVLNDSNGVTIEVEGEQDYLEVFQHTLHDDAPPLARVDLVEAQVLPLCGEVDFIIAHSQSGAAHGTLISPDTATCDECLREVFDPTDRRFAYPFTNCTNCGPRFTIVQDVPYDRDKTTMRDFALCATCRAEYDDPLNRRFHAQPNACPVCGPQVRYIHRTPDANCDALYATEAMREAARQLAAGAILAIKGLGGYHLACDAYNAQTVARLRSLKHREAKPFALLAADLATVQRLCSVDEAEATLLESRRRPIVLLERRPDCAVAPGITPMMPPGHGTLGFMLPYTPLHHLLLDAFAQVSNADHPPVLVMTSGNRSDEPIAYHDDDAAMRLAGIADGTLLHNRPIHIRCDDSVTRIVAGGEQIFRRARGYAPEPLRLGVVCRVPLLACGGHLKNTFCLVKRDQAFLSHHIGDLENLETLTAYRSGIEHMERLFGICPQAVAYDLHPEYLATKHALEYAVPHAIGVQHHHAHIASVLAEHRLSGPVIGIAADGTGYGSDGAVWGGEIMLADLVHYERLFHLGYVPLAGGERAIREPWRMAAVYLAQAYGEDFLELPIPFVQRLDPRRWRPLAQMIERGINSPPTSSLGRLFDAVAALLGLRDNVLYEGQAAIELELLAVSDTHTYACPVDDQRGTGATSIDMAPLIRAIVADLEQNVPIPLIAGRFHRSISTLLAQTCVLAHRRSGVRDVALSGGVFQNRLLLEHLIAELESLGFRVLINRRVPPNDGGLSLGQAVIAAATLQRM